MVTKDGGGRDAERVGAWWGVGSGESGELLELVVRARAAVVEMRPLVRPCRGLGRNCARAQVPELVCLSAF